MGVLKVGGEEGKEGREGQVSVCAPEVVIAYYEVKGVLRGGVELRGEHAVEK